MNKILFLALFLLTFSACTALKYAQVNVDLTKVSIGMSENQVIEVLGKPSNIISAYQDNKGEWKVYEYMREELNSYLNTRTLRPYWLYFLNGKLERWTPGEDWQGDQAILKSRLDQIQNRKEKNEEKSKE